MAYVGRSPRYGFLEGQTATFNGSTTVVTLQRNVSSTDAIDVFIDNVHQEPDVAYTLSSGGNSITFTGTPDNGAVLYIRFHGIAFDTARAYRLVNSDEGSSLTLGNDDTLTLSLDGTTALTATSSGITIPNLTVTGTTTSVNSTNLNIGDNTILLNSDVANDAAPTESAGITINRGSSADVDFIWNETNDEWYAGNDLATGGIFRVKGGGTTPTLSGSTLAAFTRSAATNNASIAIIGNSSGYSSVHFGDENDEDVGQLNYSHTADTFALNKGLGVTGNITVSGTVDGVDIATRDGILTSTTTTAGAALPKAGGTMTGDLNLGSGVALEVNGTTVIDSSRNGSFADLEFTGSLTHAWTNSGVISIGVAQRGGNIYNTGQNLLQVMGADAYIGGQAMAGGDLLLRGGFAVDNAGLSVYPGDVTIRGGVPHSGTDGNGGKIYLQTGGTSANRLTIRGDGNIGVGMGGSSSAKFTIQGKAGTVGNSITDKTLHVIEGGYNDGPTFQVSNSSGVSRFQVDGTGRVGIGVSSLAGVADSTGVQALQLGGTHLIHYDEDAAGTSSFSNNVYWNGSQNTTVFSGKASQIYMENGSIIFRNSDDNHGVGAQVANFHERLRINSEGKIGINSSDPNFLVHINKGTSSYAPASTTETVLGVNSSYDAAGTLGFNITQMDGNWLDGTSGGDTAFGPIWTHQNNVRAGVLYDVRNTEKFQLFSSYGPIEFMTNTTATVNAVPTDSSMTTKMKIAQNGNVGIGIDPQVLLHVQAGSTGNGTVRIGGGAGLQISHDNSAATVQTIESLYRTTSASANLQIKTGHLTIFTGTSGAQAMDISETGNVDIAGVLTNDAKRIIDHPTQSHALAHYQELVCHNALTTSQKNTWVDVAFTGHSCIFKVYGATLENGNNALGGARLITNMLVTYGSDAFTTDAYKVTAMNGGGISSLEYRYLNSGGNAGSHRLQARVNWSTSNTMAVYTTITGMSETLSVVEDN